MGEMRYHNPLTTFPSGSLVFHYASADGYRVTRAESHL